ncbi:hypothetical protein [Reyranella sp.]|uniref:hypothetical protein n=1 Tax=Reyranella sp. TaxID=1929291 RepID=UPI0025DBC529|nr:hypothetical protein [Reyranella sp.]
MTVIHTDRLTLRPMIAADAEPYAGLRFHPEVARWLPPAAAGVAGAAVTSGQIEAAGAAIARFEQA